MLLSRSLHTTMLHGRGSGEPSIETASTEVLPLLLHCKDGKLDCKKNVKKFTHPEHLLCYTYSPHSVRKTGLSNGVTMVFLTAGGIMKNLTKGMDSLWSVPGFEQSLEAGRGDEGMIIMLNEAGESFCTYPSIADKTSQLSNIIGLIM